MVQGFAEWKTSPAEWTTQDIPPQRIASRDERIETQGKTGASLDDVRKSDIATLHG